MKDFRESDKYQKAKAALPARLHGAYEELVGQYSFHTTRLFGRGYVAYEVLAALVLGGWRPSAAEPVEARRNEP